MQKDRRDLIKLILASSAFAGGLAGAVRFNSGDGIKVGNLRIAAGLSEAQAICGSSFDCSGGGGQCGSSFNCSGGGGECGSSFDCSGGGGKCGSSFNCGGS